MKIDMIPIRMAQVHQQYFYKRGNSLLAVRNINHIYVAIERKNDDPGN